MQTIVLATQKGGSGKSTLAIGLALAAIRAGHNVRLIETDPQGTVSNWKRRRPYAAPIIEPIYAAREVEQRLQSLAHDGVTVTIVDTAGGESAATNSAIRYSDLCLIPTRPSIADIEATAATLRVITESTATTCPPKLNERRRKQSGPPAPPDCFATACGAASARASCAIFPRASDRCDGQARCSRQVRRRSFA